MMNMKKVQRLLATMAVGLTLSLTAEAGTHAWLPLLKSTSPTEPISQRYDPPTGYHRVAAEPHSFAAWLRTLPIRTDRMNVLSYKDEPLNRPSAGIVAIDVGDRDLMQCADSIIRLHAEYLWAYGRQNEAAYRFTSGDETQWADWVSGERFQINGSGVTRTKGKPRTASHAVYRRWLDLVFTYAGTRSLARDAARPSVDAAVEPGEFYVDAGSPGHAVIVLDVVTNGSGVRLGLLGQGFMPAEDIHVLRSSLAIDGVWFRLPDREEEVLPTPSWKPFGASSRRRLH
ncbi:MAG: hypothetical protein CL930_07155 [Deltaproteobacteria bacterium]|nr:hypothetical protein [Deltaproteobacteria bacterium]MAY80547.1 hypothetical protein [Deltaproteobacteria bacterium]